MAKPRLCVGFIDSMNQKAQPTDPRPGWLIIDRYMSNASDEEREAAYENLKRLMSVLWEIDQRITREKREQERTQARSDPVQQELFSL